MRALTRIGDKEESSRLIPVRSIHIPDWCSNQHSKAWEWLEELSGKSSIPITANPGGLDNSLATRREALENIRPSSTYSCSCTPYLMGNHPNGVVAWGGRAASAFANSILGARSDLESFESAVASAITGLTPERGLHLDAKRQATIAVRIDGLDGLDYASLGWLLSRQLKNEVPLLCGVKPNFDQAKRLAFSMNADGNMPLFRMQRDNVAALGMESIHLDGRVIEEAIEVEADFTPDLAIIGCPHLSEQEINRMSRGISGHRPTSLETWFFTSRLCFDKCPKTGAVLCSRGKMFIDCCPLALRHEIGGRKVVCDSPVLASELAALGIRSRFLPPEPLSKLMMEQ